MHWRARSRAISRHGRETGWTPRKAEASAGSTRRHRPLVGESGQAAVEFGLVVPFLCFLVLALVDFGKGVNYWLDSTHLANEGARLAATLGNAPAPGGGTLQSFIQQQAETTELRDGTGSVTSAAQVCISFLSGPTGTTGQIGDPVQVTVTAKYQWIPFIGGGTYAIRGASTMRLEQVPLYAQGCS